MSAAKKKKCALAWKKNPQDNGDRLALIVFLNPIFWVLPVPRSLAQNYMGVANSVGLATPSSQLLLWSHSNRALSWLTMGRLWKKMDCLKVCAFKKKSASLSRQHDIITEKKTWSHSAVTWPHEFSYLFCYFFHLIATMQNENNVRCIVYVHCRVSSKICAPQKLASASHKYEICKLVFNKQFLCPKPPIAI